MISFINQLTKLEKSIFIVILAIYFNNLFIDIMEIDAAQYAGMSAEMAQTNSFLEVKEYQNDYLDKPPLLFWLSSMSIKLFGITNFAYKLSSFVFILFSFFAVYRFSILYYSKEIGKNAVIILATTQAYFLITNDVRTDALLTSCTIISVWLFSEYFEKRKFRHLILASIFMGLGLLAKGPIGAIAVLVPIGINLIYQQKWRDIFNFRWILVLIIVAVILFPMSYGLYTQFDMHPEKGKGGLYFYYWLQSFGRITGESIWNNGAPWHFFLGTSIWDFFPWIFPLYVALFFKLKNLSNRQVKLPEITTLSGLILVFAMLSLSKYKLPHYVFVTFPFAAIISSEYLTNLNFKVWHRWKIMNYVFGILILLLLIVFNLYLFQEFNIWIIFCVLLQLFILVYFLKTKEQNSSQLVALVLILNIFLSFVFYPKLLTFQSESMAGKWASENIKNEKVYNFNNYAHAFNFYVKNPFTKKVTTEDLPALENTYWLFISADDLQKIKDLNLKIVTVKSFDDFEVSMLNIQFLVAKTRSEVVKKKYLIKIVNPSS
jgi:4-amino-4-deoxy-L-arabinose transferase-like glycosyltransferase